MPQCNFNHWHMGISPHHDLLTSLPRRIRVPIVVTFTAPAGRGRIFSGSNHNADAPPRRLAVWIALTAVLFASLAPCPAASESATLKPWTEFGSEAPTRSFRLDDLRGTPRHLQDFKGHVVVLHFFATWCEPCVREITSLRKLADIARDKPLKIVAIDVAEVDLRVRAFFEQHPVDFPVLLDRDRAVTRAWKVSALPSTYVLAPDLMPRLFVEGDLDWTQPDVLAAIERLYPIKTTHNPHRETTR